MKTLELYTEKINQYLTQSFNDEYPETLYEPVRYFMQLGGKRIRPVLVLLGCSLFEGSESKALHAAAAIEIFHNFTLMHDDIMDHAPLRRGNATVHSKYNIAQAILSGDIMLVKAYTLLNKLPENCKSRALEVFNQTASGVCKGQQIDMDFEKQKKVDLTSYLEMIRLKTAVLLGGALQLGAVVAYADEIHARRIYDAGTGLGLAFQLYDDYLDVFGNEVETGKRVGGDILAEKKTFLWVHAMQHASTSQIADVEQVMKSGTDQEKISLISHLYKTTQADIELKNRLDDYYNMAITLIDETGTNKESRNDLKKLINWLMNRNY